MSNSEQKRKQTKSGLLFFTSPPHSPLWYFILFFLIYIKCMFFDVQGFQFQICIALLNVLIIIVLRERPNPLLLIVSLFFCSNEASCGSRRHRALCDTQQPHPSLLAPRRQQETAASRLFGFQCEYLYLFLVQGEHIAYSAAGNNK